MKIKIQKIENQKEYKKRAPGDPIGDIKHNNKIREFKTRGGGNVQIEVDKMSISITYE